MVNVHYDAIISVPVLAENEETAREKAKAIAYSRPQSEFDFEYSDCCVTDEEEIEQVADDNSTIVLAFPKVEYDREVLDTCTRKELLAIADKDSSVFRYESFQQCLDEISIHKEITDNYTILSV